MGILYETMYAIQVGKWRSSELHKLQDAERIVNKLRGVFANARIEAEGTDRK